jgi:hypothetical protein
MYHQQSATQEHLSDAPRLRGFGNTTTYGHAGPTYVLQLTSQCHALTAQQQEEPQEPDQSDSYSLLHIAHRSIGSRCKHCVHTGDTVTMCEKGCWLHLRQHFSS